MSNMIVSGGGAASRPVQPLVSDADLAQAPIADFRAFFRGLWRGKWIIAGCALAALALGLVLVYRMEPSFTAASRVLLAADEVVGGDQTATTETLSDQKLATEVEIIYSTSILGSVVDQLGLADDSGLAEDERDKEGGEFGRLEETLRGLLRPAGDTAEDAGDIAGDTAAGPSDDGGDNGGDDEGDVPEVARPMPSPRSVAINYLRDFLTVTRVADSRVIALAFTAGDPTTAATLSNAIAKQYILDRTSARRSARQQQVAWLDERVAALRDEIQSREKAAEQKRAELAAQSGQSLDITQSQLDARAKELAQVQGETARLELLRTQLESALTRDGVPETIAQFRDSSRVAELQQNLDETTDRLRNLSQDSPVRPMLEAQIATIHRDIRAEATRIASGVGEDLRASQAREAMLKNTVRGLESQALEQTRASLDLRQLEADAEIARQNYEDTYRELLRVSGRLESVPSDVRILSSAEPPEFEDSRRSKLIIAFVTLTGLLLGTGFVVLRDQLRDAPRSVAALEAATGLPVLASIPPLRSRASALPDLARGAPGLGEALRQLATSLIEIAGPRASTVLMFVSSLPGEGCAEVALLAAAQLRKLGREVVFVDCDMRSSRVPRAFQGEPGLYDVLQGRAGVDAVVRTDPKTGLAFIPAGATEARQPDAADAFYGSGTNEVVDALRARYGFVILNVPATLSAAEVRMIAPSADAMLLVARGSVTSRSTIASGLQALGTQLARVRGVVLTGAGHDGTA